MIFITPYLNTNDHIPVEFLEFHYQFADRHAVSLLCANSIAVSLSQKISLKMYFWYLTNYNFSVTLSILYIILIYKEYMKFLIIAILIIFLFLYYMPKMNVGCRETITISSMPGNETKYFFCFLTFPH